jgi:hypothetical protein
MELRFRVAIPVASRIGRGWVGSEVVVKRDIFVENDYKMLEYVISRTPVDCFSIGTAASSQHEHEGADCHDLRKVLTRPFDDRREVRTIEYSFDFVRSQPMRVASLECG